VFTPDKGDADAYVECPSCGAMAMSVGEATDALARNLSSTHDAGQLQDRTTESPVEDEDEDSGLVNRDPSLVHNFAGAGIFSGLLDVPEKTAAPPPPVVGGLDLGLEDELGDFELPATAPGNPALSPQKKTAPPKKAASSSSAAPPKRATPIEQNDDVSASFGDDALDALGAAFDSMAQRPSQARGADGLSDDERSFLRADAPPPSNEPKAPPRRPPPRPPGKPGERRQPPPPRAKKRDRVASTGIALSAEAKEAAFLPLKASSSPPAPVVDTDVRPRAQRQAAAAAGEATLPGGSVPVEPTQVLTRPKQGPAPREKPTVLGGVPIWAMAAAVVIGLLGGGAAGAFTAPAPVKRNDARGHAEEKLIEGNRFYAAQRWADALASYKAALNYDRAFPLAHRAKGAALARAERYDEAAEAYRDYLALEPSAIDAGDIKEALVRRGVAPVAGGEGVR